MNLLKQWFIYLQSEATCDYFNVYNGNLDNENAPTMFQFTGPHNIDRSIGSHKFITFRWKTDSSVAKSDIVINVEFKKE